MTCIPARYIVAILGAIGMALVHGLRVNLSVIIVSMVKKNEESKQLHSRHGNLSDTITASSVSRASFRASECQESPDDDLPSKYEDGPFAWSTTVQGAIKSSHFWGYIVSQIPGGRIAELWSAKWVMFFAIAVNVIGAVLSPVAANVHYGFLIAARVVQGIGGGVTFPTMHVILSNWAPPLERSIMSSIVYSGPALGTVVFTSSVGIITAELGWEASFYIHGAAAALWLPLWFFMVADTPEKQTLISDEERAFIVSSLRTNDRNLQTMKAVVPWKAILTSPPFLAILISHTCGNWGWYMLLIELPTYMKNVLKVHLARNALLSAIPHLCLFFFTIILGRILDKLRTKQAITTTTARKIATSIGSFIPAICLLSISYAGCMRTLAIALLTLAVTANGGMLCGFLSNHIDIAPNFAGTLIGITNFIATIPGIIVPLFLGKLTESKSQVSAWQTLFWVTIGLYMFEITVYLIFASGEEQAWNRYNDQAS